MAGLFAVQETALKSLAIHDASIRLSAFKGDTMISRFLVCGFTSGLVCGGALADKGYSDDHPYNDVETVQPPVPQFPLLPSLLGIQAKCEVEFDLHGGGAAKEFGDTRCTHLAFCDEARRAADRLKLRVVDVPGAPNPGSRLNVIYPIVFALEGRDAVEYAEDDFMICEGRPDLVS